MSVVGMEAIPLSQEVIRDFAREVRQVLGYNDQMYVDVEELIDFALPKADPDFFYTLFEEQEMGENHGQAAPARSAMYLREDVWQGMRDGDAQHRETVMHEVGHLLMHKPTQIRMNKNPRNVVREQCDPEWQADTFAAEFMAPPEMARQCKTAAELARRTGIPFPVANKQWKLYKEAGLI